MAIGKTLRTRKEVRDICLKCCGDHPKIFKRQEEREQFEG
jgi:hypothetical protein